MYLNMAQFAYIKCKLMSYITLSTLYVMQICMSDADDSQRSLSILWSILYQSDLSYNAKQLQS